MKTRSLALSVCWLLVFTPASAEQPDSAPPSQPPAAPSPETGSGRHHGPREGRTRHGHPPGCRCCGGRPLGIPFGYGYGYGGGWGGYGGVTIGAPIYSPTSLFDRLLFFGLSRSSPSPRTPTVRPRHHLEMSSPEARARAARQIELGDEAFARQQYAQAMGRYRNAIKAAPDRGEAQFRLAQAYLATGKFAQAADAIARGLRFDPSWPESGFNVQQFYAGNEAARLAHLERLAETARDDFDNPVLLFLLGYQLYFSHEPERALPFFERAMLLADDPDPILAFLQSSPRDLADRSTDPTNEASPGPKPGEDSQDDAHPAGGATPEAQKI